jgi:D-lactate dehydrogenase
MGYTGAGPGAIQSASMQDLPKRQSLPIQALAINMQVTVFSCPWHAFDSNSHDPDRRLRHQTLRPRTLQRAAAGLDIEWRFMDCRLSAETAAAAHGARAVCTFVNDRVDRPCLEALAKLGVKHVALRCAGFNSIDLPAAKEIGFAVTRVPAYSPYAVAEHAVALLLALNRKISACQQSRARPQLLAQRTRGLRSHGKTAGHCRHGKDWPHRRAEFFADSECVVLAFDPYPVPEWAQQYGIEYTDPRTLASECDVISLHTPLTPETHHIIRRETLSE